MKHRLGEDELASMTLKVSSWRNISRVIRHKDTRLTTDTSNFWASLQWLEQQLEDQLLPDEENDHA